MKTPLIILCVLASLNSFSLERIWFDSKKTFFPSQYLTDGKNKIEADWAGVYKIANTMRHHPEAYEHAYRYEKYAKRVKWLSVVSVVSFGAMVLGGISTGDAFFWGGAASTIISTFYGLRYQAKAVYHLHKAVNSYNKQFNQRPSFSLSYHWAF